MADHSNDDQFPSTSNGHKIESSTLSVDDFNIEDESSIESAVGESILNEDDMDDATKGEWNVLESTRQVIVFITFSLSFQSQRYDDLCQKCLMESISRLCPHPIPKISPKSRPHARYANKT